MTPEHMGFAVLCDATGVIQSVLVATQTRHLQLSEGLSLGHVFLPDDKQKLHALLDAAMDSGSALGWEFRVRTPTGDEPASVNAVRTAEGILLVASRSQPQVLLLLEDVVRMNSELVNAVRELQKQGDGPLRRAADTEVDALTSLNNDLINLQRELAQRNAELERSRHLVSSIIDLAPVVIYLLDARTGAPTFANNELQHMMQHPFDSPTESVRQLFATLIDPDHLERRAESLAQLQESPDDRVLEWSFHASIANGEARWLHARETVFARSVDGRASQILGVLQDVTASHLAAEQATALAHTDNLTGLNNHRGFEALSTVAVARSARTGEPVGVIYADLNGLKQINDRYGHAAGDVAIVTFASALKNVARESDIVARMGGDEFLIVLTEGAEAGIARLLERLEEELRSAAPETAYPIVAAYGTALGRASTMPELLELVERADHDMYEQKIESKADGHTTATDDRPADG